MAKNLITTVHVPGHGVFGPGDKLPAEVRKLLADNPRVWDDGEDEAEETHPGPSETADAGKPVEEAAKAAQEHDAGSDAAGQVSGEPKPAARLARRSK